MEPEKRCPFCDGDCHVTGDGELYWVVCENCDCDGPTERSAEAAVTKWDTRVSAWAARKED
jgi:hypothetical protein